MAEKTDKEKAIDQLKGNATKYAKPSNYYDGVHELRFATDKFKNAFGSLFKEFALNLCPAVVDAVRDKLVITEFSIEKGSGKKAADEAWRIWQENRMGVRSGEIHKEAVKSGDAYAIVWVDPAGKVTIYPNRAASCTVMYDEETPGKILWGAKIWSLPDKKMRLNMFFPDRIERYITSKKVEGGIPDAKEFIDFTDDSGATGIKNPYGVVPIFHFANNADVGTFGRSELKDVIPVQDGLNKSVLDMLVAMEFASYRQRWAAGIEIEFDDDGKPIPPFQAGIEKLWITENNEAKFGDFEATELKQFLEVKDSFRTDFATVSGTPLYYFMQTGANFPQSGESYRRSETRFINKIRDRQQAFGAVWEDVIEFAMRIENKGENRVFAQWEEPDKLTEKEQLENLLLKKDLGVNDERLWMEAGYGEADITEMTEAKEKAAEDAATRFNRGEDGGGGFGE